MKMYVTRNVKLYLKRKLLVEKGKEEKIQIFIVLCWYNFGNNW